MPMYHFAIDIRCAIRRAALLLIRTQNAGFTRAKRQAYAKAVVLAQEKMAAVGFHVDSNAAFLILACPRGRLEHDVLMPCRFHGCGIGAMRDDILDFYIKRIVGNTILARQCAKESAQLQYVILLERHGHATRMGTVFLNSDICLERGPFG